MKRRVAYMIDPLWSMWIEVLLACVALISWWYEVWIPFNFGSFNATWWCVECWAPPWVVDVLKVFLNVASVILGRMFPSGDIVRSLKMILGV